MTPEQRALLTQRQSTFREFEAERGAALIGFIETIGIQPAKHVGANAAAYLPHLTKVLRDMRCESDRERTVLSARVSEYIGEYFAQRFGGRWFVNDTPGSPTFARYVVGQFTMAPGSPVCIDPFEIGMAFARQPKPRELTLLLAKVESELKAAIEGGASATGTLLH